MRRKEELYIKIAHLCMRVKCVYAYTHVHTVEAKGVKRTKSCWHKRKLITNTKNEKPRCTISMIFRY